MKHDLAQDIALMRYAMISPLIIGLPNEYDSKEAYFRAASEREAIHPAPTSIKRWYQHYQKKGFDGLLPAGRSDQGTSRKIDPDLEEQIRYLKATYPRVSAAAIFRQLCDNGSTNRNKLSESTVNRFLNNLALKEKMTNNKDMRRYERPHVNQYNQSIHSSLNGKSPQERYFSEPNKESSSDIPLTCKQSMS